MTSTGKSYIPFLLATIINWCLITAWYKRQRRDGFSLINFSLLSFLLISNYFPSIERSKSVNRFYICSLFTIFIYATSYFVYWAEIAGWSFTISLLFSGSPRIKSYLFICSFIFFYLIISDFDIILYLN